MEKEMNKDTSFRDLSFKANGAHVGSQLPTRLLSRMLERNAQGYGSPLHSALCHDWFDLLVAWRSEVIANVRNSTAANQVHYSFVEHPERDGGQYQYLATLGPWAQNRRAADPDYALVIPWADTLSDLPAMLESGHVLYHPLVLYAIAYPVLVAAFPLVAEQLTQELTTRLLDRASLLGVDHTKCASLIYPTLEYALGNGAPNITHQTLRKHRESLQGKEITPETSVFMRIAQAFKCIFISDGGPHDFVSVPPGLQHTYLQGLSARNAPQGHYSVVLLRKLNSKSSVQCRSRPYPKLESIAPAALCVEKGSTEYAEVFDIRNNPVIAKAPVSVEDAEMLYFIGYVNQVINLPEYARLLFKRGGIYPYPATDTSKRVALNVGLWSDLRVKLGSPWYLRHVWPKVKADFAVQGTDSEAVRHISQGQYMVANVLCSRFPNVFSLLERRTDGKEIIPEWQALPGGKSEACSTNAVNVDTYVVVTQSGIFEYLTSLLRKGVPLPSYLLSTFLVARKQQRRANRRRKAIRTPKGNEPRIITKKVPIKIQQDGYLRSDIVDIDIVWRNKVPKVSLSFLDDTRVDVYLDGEATVAKDIRKQLSEDSKIPRGAFDKMDADRKHLLVDRLLTLERLPKRFARSTRNIRGVRYYAIPFVLELCQELYPNHRIADSIPDWHTQLESWFKRAYKEFKRDKHTREVAIPAALASGVGARGIRHTKEGDVVIIALMRPGVLRRSQDLNRIFSACAGRSWRAIRDRASVLRNQLIAEGVYDIEELPHLQYNARIGKAIAEAKSRDT